jgi:hypothetical protein
MLVAQDVSGIAVSKWSGDLRNSTSPAPPTAVPWNSHVFPHSKNSSKKEELSDVEKVGLTWKQVHAARQVRAIAWRGSAAR